MIEDLKLTSNSSLSFLVDSISTSLFSVISIEAIKLYCMNSWTLSFHKIILLSKTLAADSTYEKTVSTILRYNLNAIV
jgi:hypothetical protein